MSRTGKDIEQLYNKIQKKKQAKGQYYSQADFLRDIGITRAGTFSDWTSGRRQPGLQSEMLMDVLEDRELR